ncbi:hypothetical protein H6G94_06365 [Nostoc punctiforme FACHB-252]|uniref:Uncharacterized protein n=1 Tax=Nostoc punctiforme FACHB-252 TaxID=1357509 RepID=A0ABR8H5A1_NOSPU|nr:hypothetical protein [Nostoc punctiforme]MBD2610893.1 hypothetical protein [Nostoc punctiforme FACHB-252]
MGNGTNNDKKIMTYALITQYAQLKENIKSSEETPQTQEKKEEDEN